MALILAFDEIDGDLRLLDGGFEIPKDASDQELVCFLRDINGDTRVEPHNWRCDKITRGNSIAAIEWRSARNHLAVNVVIWS